MHVTILYVRICVELNVYSPFDQDVSLPNVTGGANVWGGVRAVDLGIKATSVKYINIYIYQLHSTPERSGAQ